MSNKLKEAFEPIQATDELRQNLSQFVCGEISRRQHKTRMPFRYALTCCIAAFLIVFGMFNYNLYAQTPVSYISVDVNPSVELALNRFDRVVRVTAYNDDGDAILQNLDLKNKPYTKALELLLSDQTFEQYQKDDALLTFTVVSDKEEVLLAGIKQCRGYERFNTECHGSSQDQMDAAHQSGLSVGKYQAFLELSQYDKTITTEDCKHLSMREIRDLISQYTGAESAPSKPDGCENPNEKSNGNGDKKGKGGGNGSGHMAEEGKQKRKSNR